MRTLTNEDVAAVASAVVIQLKREQRLGLSVPEVGVPVQPVLPSYTPDEFAERMQPKRSTWWVRKQVRLGRIKRCDGPGHPRIPHSELVRLTTIAEQRGGRYGFCR